jgi:protein O-GlcNAc transferase
MNFGAADLLNLRLQAALDAEKSGNANDALRRYRSVLEIDPAHPGALLRIAQAELLARRNGTAIEMLRRAIASARERGLASQSLPIHSELVVALRESNPQERLLAARDAQQDCGEVPGFIWEECECLRALAQTKQRLIRLNRLAALQPNDAVILAELGLALSRSNSSHQAMKPMREAIALGFDDYEFALAVAAIEMQNGEMASAKERIDRQRGIDSNHFGALGLRWHLAAQCCDWISIEQLEPELLARAADGAAHSAVTPWRMLASDASPAQLRDYARNYARVKSAQQPKSDSLALFAQQSRAAHERIRVGYLSSDFHRHATAVLMADVFERHDRSRFEIFAYSYGARVEDEYRTRLRKSFDHWHELNDLSDERAAELIAEHEIDVLIELKGHTFGARPAIAAHRPAPVQAHFLGYPGTLALPGIDYFVADEVVVPHDREHEFTERIVRVSGCYQPSDARRAKPAPTDRSLLSLPADAIVLCNFNQSWKWRQRFVAVWLRALAAQPRALLWLLDPGNEHPAKANIEALAHEFGVAGRVVWAPPLEPDRHLARLAQADLALDQLPCSSHTTAADALWMGVPLLTCIGERIDGRVAASLLAHRGQSNWVTGSIEQYEQRLTEFLRTFQRTERANTAPVVEDASARFITAWEQTLSQLNATAVATKLQPPLSHSSEARSNANNAVEIVRIAVRAGSTAKHVVNLIGGERTYRYFVDAANVIVNALRACRIDVELVRNEIHQDSTNYIFGGHLISNDAVLNRLNERTVFVNSEPFAQPAHVTIDWPRWRQILAGRVVWDYSQRNIAVLRDFAKFAYWVPIGFGAFETIQGNTPQDTDVLFYGFVNDRRRNILEGCRTRGLRVVVLPSGTWGNERREAIARSKIVLNVGAVANSVFEQYRVSHAMSLGKAVVTEMSAEEGLPANYSNGLAVARYHELVDRCVSLAADDAARHTLEINAVAGARALDTVAYVRRALASASTSR